MKDQSKQRILTHVKALAHDYGWATIRQWYTAAAADDDPRKNFDELDEVVIGQLKLMLGEERDNALRRYGKHS